MHSASNYSLMFKNKLNLIQNHQKNTIRIKRTSLGEKSTKTKFPIGNDPNRKDRISNGTTNLI